MKKRLSLISLCNLMLTLALTLACSAADKTTGGSSSSSTGGNSSQEEMLVPNLTGSVGVGYGSRYEYRGMTVNDSISDGGVVLDGEVYYETDQMFTPLLSFTYRDMKVLETEGQINFFAGVQAIRGEDQAEGSLILSSKMGYQLINGGLPGVMKGWEKGRDLEADGGTTQEFLYNITTYRPGQVVNCFSTYSAGYSFSGLTGWYMSAGLGVEYPFTDKISATLAGNVSWSFNYWTPSNGCDQLNLILTVPMQVKPDCMFSPFIMTTWGARNAKMINHQTDRNIVENFAVVAGARFTVSF